MTIRSVLEIAFGVLFVVGAAFNAGYTLGHTDEFYGDWAANAWLGPARSFLRDQVIPHGVPVTIAVIALQMAVAAGILLRGTSVVPALLIGGTFAVGAAVFSNPTGAAANLGLAAAQYWLAWAR